MTDARVPTPTENVPRGTIFALAIVPAGILVWILIWSLGFIASVVAFGIAIGAMYLYRLGAGTMGRTGAVRVAIITVATLLIALVAGYAWDLALAYVQVNGGSPLDALGFPRFWPVVFEVMFTDGLFGTLLALGFGALGCVSVLRSGFAVAAQANAGLVNPLAPGEPVAEAPVEPAASAPASGEPPADAIQAGEPPALDDEPTSTT